jgi:hypothetical protein
MKTIALFFLLTIGLVSAAGCHEYHNGHHYSDGYYRR